MKVKAFDFSAELKEPYPRRVAVKTAIYLVGEKSLRRVECPKRSFSLELDALDFDSEFGDVLQLTIADIVRGLIGKDFECFVTECDVEGAQFLKVYEVSVDGKQIELFAVFKRSADGGISRVYAETIGNLPHWRERVSALSKALGIPVSALDAALKPESQSFQR